MEYVLERRKIVDFVEIIGRIYASHVNFLEWKDYGVDLRDLLL